MGGLYFRKFLINHPHELSDMHLINLMTLPAWTWLDPKVTCYI